MPSKKYRKDEERPRGKSLLVFIFIFFLFFFWGGYYLKFLTNVQERLGWREAGDKKARFSPRVSVVEPLM